MSHYLKTAKRLMLSIAKENPHWKGQSIEKVLFVPAAVRPLVIRIYEPKALQTVWVRI